MKNNIPKISVLVITYNQENVISRAIDSLLAQKEYIYEICVSDDCSTDRTWDILQEYSSKNPGLFKLNRNEPNIGIFENIEKTWTMPTGDVIYQLAGDDECGDGWFKQVVDFLIENNIDINNELFCIYGDYQDVYPNGDSFIFSNKKVATGISPLKLTLRGLIGNRSTCYSINVLKLFKKVSKGRSHIAEDAQDCQLQVFSKSNYYIPYVGNIYYANIGVCTKIDDDVLKEREKIRPYVIEMLREWNVGLDQYDLIYSLKFFNAFHYSNHHPTLKNRWRALCLFIHSYDPQIGFKGINLKRFVFLVLKKLPHKKPLRW